METGGRVVKSLRCVRGIHVTRLYDYCPMSSKRSRTRYGRLQKLVLFGTKVEFDTCIFVPAECET